MPICPTITDIFYIENKQVHKPHVLHVKTFSVLLVCAPDRLTPFLTR